MAWLCIKVRDGRPIGGQPKPKDVTEIWKRCKLTPFVRELTKPLLEAAGFEVGPINCKVAEYPWQASAYLCMTKGGGRAGSSVYTLGVRKDA